MNEEKFSILNNEKFVKLNEDTMVSERSWTEFRETGLFWIINTTLQIFGWSFVYEKDDETGEITRVYPARTKYRGFSTDVQEAAHKMIAGYMAENSQELKSETEL